MKQIPAFWDSSAVVPLCVHEDISPRARFWLRRLPPVVWWGSLIEVHGAICRLHRDNEISQPEKARAVARLELLSRGWREVLPGEQVRERAIDLLDRRFLRGADAVQLAASLTWCGEHPFGRSFVCRDKRLSEAARAEGFSVLDL